jgi:hypothetical protein
VAAASPGARAPARRRAADGPFRVRALSGAVGPGASRGSLRRVGEHLWRLLADDTQPRGTGRSAWSSCRAGANLDGSRRSEPERRQPIRGTDSGRRLRTWSRSPIRAAGRSAWSAPTTGAAIGGGPGGSQAPFADGMAGTAVQAGRAEPSGPSRAAAPPSRAGQSRAEPGRAGRAKPGPAGQAEPAQQSRAQPARPNQAEPGRTSPAKPGPAGQAEPGRTSPAKPGPAGPGKAGRAMPRSASAGWVGRPGATRP